ncbi:uncharacterized protein BX664DRAFT_382745 [Halteromyces radiatus]|uniref:uncharacterized protein n=1 Tax=Halteromyces radiatus TaxID=101107 RepID=UPI00221F5C97|nr:uncharacterized protein BX664DRAFT_382745 [Halteromyces radiatus]KAI8096272.1 hypothetical protein BX664DRAFT_382745 [Halteromyces radiatus]
MVLPKSDFVQAVRTTCKQLVENSPVKISEQGVKNFLTKLEKPQYEELAIDTPIRMPLKFSSVAEEINFIAVIDLLNFGSGYRVPLHELAGRGAFDVIRFGVMSFHVGGTPMTTEKFKTIDIHEVSSIFQIPIEKEVPVKEDMPFMTTVQPTPIKPFAQGIVDVLNSTGAFLDQHGYKDLAAFILDVTKPDNNKKPSAVKLVEQLVRALPGLQDWTVTPQGDTVYLFKKAQILVYHLWLIFHDQDPDRFGFDDIDDLTIFADNVIPTMLIHLGVIDIPEAWQQELDNHKDVGEYKAYVLRAASVVACEEIVKISRSDAPVGQVHHMTEGALDVYLWRLGKVGDYRKVPRMEWRNTVMF